MCTAIWLKERGDKFFGNKDYRSASNAYSSAIEMDSGMASYPNTHAHVDVIVV